MHRQQSTHTLHTLRFAAFHFLFNVLLFLTTLTCFTTGLIIDEKNYLWISVALLAFWILSVGLFFVLNLGWCCPLCLGRIWMKTGARRHRKVKPALGISYRLGIATSVMFKPSYRCPYCGEPFSSRKAHR